MYGVENNSFTNKCYLVLLGTSMSVTIGIDNTASACNVYLITGRTSSSNEAGRKKTVKVNKISLYIYKIQITL